MNISNLIVVRLSLLLASLSCLLGCNIKRDDEKSSKFQGHFEGFSNEDGTALNNEISNKFMVRPEYLSAQGVIISSKLITTYNQGKFVRELGNSGIKTLYVVGSELSVTDLQFEVNSDVQIRQLSNINVSVWARDWAPLTALKKPEVEFKSEQIFLDLNYYSNRPTDDSVPRIFSDKQSYTRVSMPVYNEGGNFMINESGHCMMTERVIEANVRGVRGSNGIDSTMSEAEIVQQYEGLAGCKKVTIFPRMPHEKTGHIDMWAKFLNDETVLVNEIDPRILEKDPEVAFIKRFLDERADEISSMGYKVVRIPMPQPTGQFFRSYTNSLLLNGKAFVPVYTPNNQVEDPSRESEAKLFVEFEERIKEIYSDAGFQYVPINSDSLIRHEGALHCSTMQVGRLN